VAEGERSAFADVTQDDFAKFPLIGDLHGQEGLWRKPPS
jgi:hypothetical protein